MTIGHLTPLTELERDALGEVVEHRDGARRQ